jgi:hypothetical protein
MTPAHHRRVQRVRMRRLYAERRAANQCTKCGTPSSSALCLGCAPVRLAPVRVPSSWVDLGFPTHAAFVVADRVEEMRALSELTAMRKARA